MNNEQFKLAERKQFRGDLSNMVNVVNDYINIDRQDFLQSKYTEFSPDEDWLKHYAKKEGEFCAIGWLAIAKDIDLPSFTHNLEPTGYVYKGKNIHTKYGEDENGNWTALGEEEVVHEVHERACECELHTQQEDEDRDTWVDDHYVDEGINYANLRNEIVPEVDKSNGDDEYKEYFVNASIDLDTLSSRSYTDTQRFVMDLIKAYNLPHVLIEHLQMINDQPSFAMLHSILGNCGHGYKLDERYAVDKELHGTKIAKCSNEDRHWSLDLGGWKKPIVDYLRTSLRPDNPVLDEMMDCDYNFQYLSNEMLKAFIKLLLTKDRFADYYISDDLKSETDYMVERI